ncbi:MAG: hypothetical protein PHS79_04635 [Patescibacteria group bacterium]|nr:hypothetical protein [Patescibacteria group bacterium]
MRQSNDIGWHYFFIALLLLICFDYANKSLCSLHLKGRWILKKPNVIKFACLFCAGFAGFSSGSVAHAQTDAGRRDTCCSNFRVYAGSLLEQLNLICAANPGVAETQVRAFIKTVDTKKLTNVAHECSNIDPRLKVGSDTPVLHGCYDPRYLLPIYAKLFYEGHRLCAPSVPATIIVPCNPNNPANGCSNTVIVMPTDYKSAEIGPAGPTTNNSTFVYNFDVQLGQNDRSEKPTSPQAPEPIQPQVATDSVFGTDVGLLRPSDTRLTAVQVPFMVTQNGTFGTAGVSFSPFRLYQSEANGTADLGVLRLAPLIGPLLERLNISLGATKSPGMMDKDASTDGAVALSFQHINDYDPTFNVKLASCLQGKVQALKDAIAAECKDENTKAACEFTKAKQQNLAAREAFRECLSSQVKSAAAAVIGASSELTRFWYTYEGSLDWYLSWLAYGGMQYNRHQEVFVPAEGGGQISLSTPSFSGFADFSIMLGDVDGRMRLRPTGGLGMSIPTFSGMSASFGVRFAPLSWQEDWNWHRAFGLMEKRYIIGFGWAGNDAASQFFANALQSKAP